MIIDHVRAALAQPEQKPVGQLQEACLGRGVVLWFDKPIDQTLLYTLPAPAKELTCTWTEDDEGTWNTTCGNAFVFNDGGPKENDSSYCCYCGGKLIEAKVRQG